MESRRDARSGATAGLALLGASIDGRRTGNELCATVPNMLPVAASHLLLASCRLWTATEVDGVVAAAQEFIDEAAPGTKVRRLDSIENGSCDNPYQLALPGDATLLVSPPDGADHELLASAIDMVRTRMDALHEHAEMVQSVERLTRELEQRVSECTHGLALANRKLRAELAERERVQARLKYETLHDSLTGLPNRDHLSQRLNNALKSFHEDSTKSFAVLFMDLDCFKLINDSAGHLVGDELLVHVGKRIRACLKPDDVVARLGGDEFGVLLDGTDVEQACRVAQRLIRTLSAPFHIDGRELSTSTSVGITLAATHYRHPGELLRDADSAMYRAKSGGKHGYAVFDEELRQQAVALLESSLRRGNNGYPYADLSRPEVVSMRPSKPDFAKIFVGADPRIAARDTLCRTAAASKRLHNSEAL
ncbi:MAG: diguanylate cyclase domain-containing protein [Gammaproteobacteria bacterium]